MTETRLRARDPHRATRSSARAWLFAVLMGAISTSLAFWLGSDQSIWFDEAYTVLVVEHSVPDIISLTAVDVHPPLFYLALKAWVTVFGTSLPALRLMPARLTGLAVITGFALLRRLFDARIAAVALPLFALNPLILRYGFEVRMYSLATLISLLATLMLVRAMRSGRWHHWVLYGLLVVAGMYTLYVSVLIWLAHAIWLLAHWWNHDERTLFRQPWLWTYAASLLLFAPWVPVAAQQATNGALAANGSPVGIETLANALTMVTAFDGLTLDHYTRATE